MLNIVFVASEATPLAKTGGLADVAGSLPQALRHLGHKLTVIMPYYRRHIARAGLRPKPTGQVIDTWADGVMHACPVHEVRDHGLRFLLVEQDEYFDRDGLFGPPGDAYEDNLPRFVLFNRVALEIAASLGAPVDILHCHDWQTGMLPLLLKSQYQHYPAIASARTVFTIHNFAYQGIFDAGWISRLGIPTPHFHPGGFEFYGRINCMKAGIMAADAITTVSPSYAEEILTAEYGCHLEGFLADHKARLSGIVNGLDTHTWNPATDPHISAHYSAVRTAGKKRCKKMLQEQCGLKVSPDTPLLTLISRLADQKGIDLVAENIPAWLKHGYQIVILGSGDPATERQLRHQADRHPQQMHFAQGFNEKLAHQIYAGGDIFLMPSRFEPCGLGQLIAMRYGNVPVVRATGGLRDTVVDYNRDKRSATGIHFEAATAVAFDRAVEQAVSLYRKPATWSKIRVNALRRNSSWDASAEEYVELYERLQKGVSR